MDLALGSIPGRLLSCSVVLRGLRCPCFAQDLSPSGWANSNRFLSGLLASLVTSVIFGTGYSGLPKVCLPPNSPGETSTPSHCKPDPLAASFPQNTARGHFSCLCTCCLPSLEYCCSASGSDELLFLQIPVQVSPA